MTITAYFSRNYWKYSVFSIATIETFLAAVAIVWGITEPVGWASEKAGGALKANWPLLAVVAFIGTGLRRRPLLSFAERLRNRDITIEVKVADIFSVPGTLIIGATTTFDTQLESAGGVISERSLQGQFTKRFYDNTAHLEQDLSQALVGQSGVPRPPYPGRKNTKYDIGAVAKISIKNQPAYLLAISHLNDHAVAKSSFENIKNALARIWEFISRRGGTEPLVIPILGTGFSRIVEGRDLVAREIVLSFIAACSMQKFCERLTIVISPADYLNHDFNMYEFRDYVRHVCKYTEFKQESQQVDSTGIAG